MKKINSDEMVTIEKSKYEKLLQELEECKKQIAFLCEQLRGAKRHRFGSKSEKIDPEVAEQLTLMFNEPEFWQEDDEQEEPAVVVGSHTRAKKKNPNVIGTVPESVPVEVVEHRLDEDKCVCNECGSLLTEIGVEVHKSLVIEPATVKVREDHYYTYACRKCEKEGTSTPVVKTPKDKVLIPGSYASPEAAAYLMCQKYVMGNPLYRMEADLNRQDIKLSRQTMSNWMLKCSEVYLEPLYNHLKSRLKDEDILHADETTLQVLHEPDKPATSKSYMWMFRSGRYSKHPTVIYEYHPGRGHEYAEAFLDGFKGYLHADGYSAYRSISEDITIVGCLAHARRRFENALKNIAKGKSAVRTACQKGAAYCTKLFNLERNFSNLTPTERYRKRQELSKPILDEFFAWAEKVNALPKSGLGMAITYLLNQRAYLKNYLLDGRLEISNNRAERSIKPFVIGRKNFLFANTPKGAKGSAIMFSIIETAKENKLKPYEYLRYIFEIAPAMNLSDEEDVKKLLPENAPDECRLTSMFR